MLLCSKICRMAAIRTVERMDAHLPVQKVSYHPLEERLEPCARRRVWEGVPIRISFL